MAIRAKTRVSMSLSAVGQSDARSHVRARDTEMIIDEPLDRHGSNLGLTPTETFMASLIGCTNVISKRIAGSMGLRVGEMTVDLTAEFDRRGTMLIEEVDEPFSDIQMTIQLETDATDDQLVHLQAELARYCPIAKMIRATGCTITETWTRLPLRAHTE